MNKVGILTLNGYFNYGNRLQNYALQEVIEKLGLDCETIINKTNLQKQKSSVMKSGIEIFLEKSIKEKIDMINYKINKNRIKEFNENRYDIFEKFSKKYINETSFSISINNIPKDLENRYGYFISGSDQVWNPNDSAVSEINFMTFAPRCKRLTYAPSFGVSKIPQQYKEDYKSWLEGIDNISVREQEGAKIIKDLTGKDALVVVDPTMLLTKEQWLSISKKHDNKPNKKYLLTYFLGGISKEVNKKVKKIAKQNNLKVVNLATLKDKKYYATGPSEFIDYINDASLFMTDSFHGCVFSVLLETPFVVCDRLGHTKEQNMSSRIETFLEKFQLQSRTFDKVTDEILFEKNYIEANEILEIERKISWDYLKEVLEIRKDYDCIIN
ncbi:MAG: polysaccharide pyruvyl transferase family protein [Terrisporobacter sp.]|uniref:polysaccharide pyruvyl transferase family protein n=1 Tax=Terrisporobacter sp. TaxID=1965305 RepID=UPI00399F779A